MAVYVISDIQGCHDSLQTLLARINYRPQNDDLWFCGDLVNRGPQSLQVLRFVSSLGDRARLVLGNHDLHLLAIWAGSARAKKSDSINDVLAAHDCDDLMNWLRTQPLLHIDHDLETVLFHAALHPQWTLQQASHLADEVSTVLAGDNFRDFLDVMYGNLPDHWHDSHRGHDRLRCITNVFTRLRYFSHNEHMALEQKLYPVADANKYIPWFQVSPAAYLQPGYRYIFGHWSTLPVQSYGQVYAIDGGCLWGGQLVALRIDSTEPEWHKLDCKQSLAPRI